MSTTISPKVIAATAGSFFASALLGILLAVQSTPEILGGLSPAIGLLLMAIIPAAVTFLSGYAKTDPKRVP
jgi:hypothetical protein